MPEEINRLGWKPGMLTRVVKGGLIFAMEKSGNRYVGKSFVVDLEQYRKPVPSESNVLDWGKNSIPDHEIFRGEAIVFEVSNGKVIGWCSRREYLEASFKRIRKTVSEKQPA